MRSLEEINYQNRFEKYLNVKTGKVETMDSLSLIFDETLNHYVKWKDRKLVYTDEDLEDTDMYLYVGR